MPSISMALRREMCIYTLPITGCILQGMHSQVNKDRRTATALGAQDRPSVK